MSDITEYGDKVLSLGQLRVLLKSITDFEHEQIETLLLSAASEIGQGGCIEVSKFLHWLDSSERQGDGSEKRTGRRRVALLGGAFNPVTNAHLLLAAQVVQSGSADEVWLVPSGPRPDKPQMKTKARDRYCMCQTAVNTVFETDFPVKVSDVEVDLEEALATYDLMCKLKEENDDADFVFIIGSDWLQEGTNLAEWTSKNWNWKEGDPKEEKTVVTGSKMLQEFDFLVLRRPGYDVPPAPNDPMGLRKFGPRLSWMQMPDGMTYIEGNLSSSEIRRRTRVEDDLQDIIATAKSFFAIEGLVPRTVISYMRRLASAECMRYKSSSMDKRPRVAIYGGAFDPVTNSHLTCAAEIMRSGCADEVWLVPCGPRPDKPNLKTSPLDRFCMARIAVNSIFSIDFPVRVSGIECFDSSQEALATYDLLCKLKKKFPACDFSFVIGSDWLQPGTNLAEWTSRNLEWKPGDPEEETMHVTGRKMLEEFDFVVIQRPGFHVPTTLEDPTGLNTFGPRLTWLQLPEGMTFIEGNLSSTEIRRRTKTNMRIGLNGLTPTPVISYIHRRQLYSHL